MLKNKIPIPNNINLKSLYKFLIKKYSDAKLDTQDGLKLIWDNKWVHLRGSNTEPIMRIYAEAPTDKEAKDLVVKVKSLL